MALVDGEDDETVISEPMVGFFLYEDGDAVFEFAGQHGGVNRYSFSNSERMRDLSAAFALAADEQDEIREGGFDAVDERHLGHRIAADDTILTTADIPKGA